MPGESNENHDKYPTDKIKSKNTSEIIMPKQINFKNEVLLRPQHHFY